MGKSFNHDHPETHFSIDADGTPRSLIFDDVYFSAGEGIAESMHNYIDANNLKKRFAQCTEFVLVECGFGTGLNFMLTAQEWAAAAKVRNSTGRLHYISIEKYPLSRETIRRLFVGQNIFFFDNLLSQYPEHPQSGQTIELSWPLDGITLTLIFDDLKNALPAVPEGVDAWFLDGFSPAKNPLMWIDELYEVMGKKSAQGATASSFTSAGIVKRGLRRNGFMVKRKPGYGKKRHIIGAEKE